MSGAQGALVLTPDERAMVDGAHGDACSLAMRIVVRLARVLGARALVEVTCAHVDSCLFHGQVSLDFVDRLVELGGRVVVPTTLNVGSLDLMHPENVRASPARRASARALMDAYVALGATPTWTCAPYQLPNRPRLGEHVAWAESNAIVFANSVLGARTGRYGDFFDVCAALTGRAPDAGLHRTENRRGQVLFDCSTLPESLLRIDAAWGALGHVVGRATGQRVPVLAGLPTGASEDQLKALGAAAASSGGVGLFHAVGLTPEALTVVEAFQGNPPDEHLVVTVGGLRAARDELSTKADGRLDAVSLGTPHFSLTEFAELAELIANGRGFHPDIEFWISTSRQVLAQAETRGYVAQCREAGAKILVDTCTYVTTVLHHRVRSVMTNSAKWAWYAPANLGVDVVLASLEECVHSAQAGRVVRDEALWS